MALARERTLDFSKSNKLANQQMLTMDKEKPFTEAQWSYLVQEAIDKNRLDIVKYIFKLKKISPTYEDNYFFGTACISGNMDIINYFLDEVDIDIRNGGNYAIRYALNEKRYDVLNKIFSNEKFSFKIVDKVEQDNPEFVKAYKNFLALSKMGKFKDLLDL